MDRTIETTAGELPEIIRKYRLASTERVRVSFDAHLTENGLSPEEEDEILRAAADDECSPMFTNARDAVAYLHNQLYG